jgi:GTPase SAR1 family protein
MSNSTAGNGTQGLGEAELHGAAATTDLAQEAFTSYVVYVIAGLALLFVIFLIKKGKGKSTKREIGIVGERLSGKTQLFIGLTGGKPFETVPSITNNNAQLALGRKTY